MTEEQLKEAAGRVVQAWEPIAAYLSNVFAVLTEWVAANRRQLVRLGILPQRSVPHRNRGYAKHVRRLKAAS